VNYETQVTWDQPRPDLSLREVILTIFSFIGIALLFTVVVGLSFGGLRIFIKARYPDRVFDRPQDMEIIQLKLGQGLIEKQLRD
jgi:predicted small integral membrane protein